MANRSEAEQTAESYYDSRDADRFYEKVWGGEDIHIGLYEEGMSTVEASSKTVAAMLGMLGSFSKDSKVLDLGAGYGGAARQLAGGAGFRVSCLNLSATQNARNEMLNLDAGMQDRIHVIHGSFESVPEADASADIIWSQDSFLHSNRREVVMDEIARLLKPGGELVFTDPMQADNCPQGVLQAVYDRLELESLSSPGWYRKELVKRGLEEVAMPDYTHQLRNHYSIIRQSLIDRYDELSDDISPGYLDRMILGLENWVTAADKGYLAWHIMHFRKPA